MKKIIYGKRYDTDAAIEIAQYINGRKTDSGYYKEILYKTKNETYFLMRDEGIYIKTMIFPMSKTEALRWLENLDFIDEIEQYFGDMISDA